MESRIGDGARQQRRHDDEEGGTDTPLAFPAAWEAQHRRYLYFLSPKVEAAFTTDNTSIFAGHILFGSLASLLMIISLFSDAQSNGTAEKFKVATLLMWLSGTLLFVALRLVVTFVEHPFRQPAALAKLKLSDVFPVETDTPASAMDDVSPTSDASQPTVAPGGHQFSVLTTMRAHDTSVWFRRCVASVNIITLIAFQGGIVLYLFCNYTDTYTETEQMSLRGAYVIVGQLCLVVFGVSRWMWTCVGNIASLLAFVALNAAGWVIETSESVETAWIHPMRAASQFSPSVVYMIIHAALCIATGYWYERHQRLAFLTRLKLEHQSLLLKEAALLAADSARRRLPPHITSFLSNGPNAQSPLHQRRKAVVAVVGFPKLVLWANEGGRGPCECANFMMTAAHAFENGMLAVLDAHSHVLIARLNSAAHYFAFAFLTAKQTSASDESETMIQLKTLVRRAIDRGVSVLLAVTRQSSFVFAAGIQQQHDPLTPVFCSIQNVIVTVSHVVSVSAVVARVEPIQDEALQLLRRSDSDFPDSSSPSPLRLQPASESSMRLPSLACQDFLSRPRRRQDAPRRTMSRSDLVADGGTASSFVSFTPAAGDSCRDSGGLTDPTALGGSNLVGGGRTTSIAQVEAAVDSSQSPSVEVSRQVAGHGSTPSAVTSGGRTSDSDVAGAHAAPSELTVVVAPPELQRSSGLARLRCAFVDNETEGQYRASLALASNGVAGSSQMRGFNRAVALSHGVAMLCFAAGGHVTACFVSGDTQLDSLASPLLFAIVSSAIALVFLLHMWYIRFRSGLPPWVTEFLYWMFAGCFLLAAAVSQSTTTLLGSWISPYIFVALSVTIKRPLAFPPLSMWLLDVVLTAIGVLRVWIISDTASYYFSVAYLLGSCIWRVALDDTEATHFQATRRVEKQAALLSENVKSVLDVLKGFAPMEAAQEILFYRIGRWRSVAEQRSKMAATIRAGMSANAVEGGSKPIRGPPPAVLHPFRSTMMATAIMERATALLDVVIALRVTPDASSGCTDTVFVAALRNALECVAGGRTALGPLSCSSLEVVLAKYYGDRVMLSCRDAKEAAHRGEEVAVLIAAVQATVEHLAVADGIVAEAFRWRAWLDWGSAVGALVGDYSPTFEWMSPRLLVGHSLVERRPETDGGSSPLEYGQLALTEVAAESLWTCVSLFGSAREAAIASLLSQPPFFYLREQHRHATTWRVAGGAPQRVYPIVIQNPARWYQMQYV